MQPRFKKTINQRSKAVTATCFECNRSIGFSYDILMNIETSNIAFYDTEYFIPNPRIRCPHCKKDMEIHGNAVGRMSSVLRDYIDPSDINKYHFDIKYTKGTNDGRKLINHEIVQTYTYPKYEIYFKDRPEYWTHMYQLITSIEIDDDFKFNGENIIDCLIQIVDQDTSVLTIFFIKNRIIEKYMTEENIDEISFESYFSMKFSDYLNYIAYELRKLLDAEVKEKESHTFI